MPFLEIDPNITFGKVMDLVNITGDPAEFFIKVNHTVFGGWLFFILLWVLGVIIFLALQKGDFSPSDNPLINALAASGILTLGSLILRVVQMVIHGTTLGLLTDPQMWIFPVITILLSFIVWAIKE